MIEKQIDQELLNIIIYSFKGELRAITVAILTNIISISINVSSLQCSYTGIDFKLLLYDKFDIVGNLYSLTFEQIPIYH